MTKPLTRKRIATLQKYVTSSTQTSPTLAKNRHTLVVLAKPLSVNLVREKLELQNNLFKNRVNSVEESNCDGDYDEEGEKQQEEGETEVNGNKSCIEAPSSTILKRPDVLYRLPENYDTFAKPITNNHKANSTLASISFEKPAKKLKRRRSICKPVKYIKPGPKCTKPKQYFLENLQIPVMLDDDHNSENYVSPLLSPIREETETTPIRAGPSRAKTVTHESSGKLLQFNVDKIVNISSENTSKEMEEANESVPVPILEKHNTQDRQESNSGVENIQTNEIQNDARKDNVTNEGENQRTRVENVRLNYGSYTTVVRTRRTGRNQDESEISSEEESPNRGRKKKSKRSKYILIEADTVHIQNHFYNR